MPKHYEFLIKYKNSTMDYERIKAASHLRAAFKFIEEEEPDDTEILEIVSQDDYGEEPVIKTWSVEEVLRKIENKKKRSSLYGSQKGSKSKSNPYAAAAYAGFSYGPKNEVCPNCGSSNIATNKKGFSLGKGLVGAVLTGGVGIVAGLHGKNKLYITCLSCGNKWNV